jgi:ABC-2 type transport system permease protein
LSKALYLINTLFKASFTSVLAPRRGRLVQLASYLIVIAIFLGGGYLLFYKIFAYLAGLADIGRPLMFRLLSTAFLTFFLMLFLSNLITSLSTLYYSPEVEYLLGTPLPVTELFGYRFYQNFFYSTWATMILGLPMLAALAAALKAGAFSFLLYLISLFLFASIPAFLAVAALLLLVKLFPKMGLKQLAGFMLLFLGAASWAFFIFGRPSGMVITQIDTMPELERYLAGLALVSSPLLPSTWLTQLMLPPAGSGPALVIKMLWLLLVTAAFFGALCFYTAGKLYNNTLTGRTSASGPQKQTGRPALSLPPARLFPVAIKDTLLFLRDPTQWAQGLIFLSLLVIYLGGIRTYPLLFTFSVWKVAVAFINFAFAGYILATLSVRFVFPVISLEGPMMWLLKSSPLTPRKLFAQKSVLSIAVALVLTEGLSLISNHILRTQPGMRYLSAFSLGLMCLAVTSLVLGLGALFPDFRERNPSKIASGLGGLLAALAALGYVGLSVAVLAWPAYLYSANMWRHNISYGGALTVALGLFVLISAVVIWVPLRFGLKELERHET